MTFRTLFVFMVLLCGIGTPILPQSSFAQEPTTDSAAQEALSTVEADTSALTEGQADVSLRAKLLQPNIDTEELELRLVPLTKDELKQLAEEWLQIVKSKTERVMEAPPIWYTPKG